jgi:hypothetical protein
MVDETEKDELARQRLELDQRIHEDQLRLDEQRLKLEQESQDQQNKIDLARSNREGKLFRANAAAIITALVSLFISGIAGYQVYLNQTAQAYRDQKEADAKQQDLASRNREIQLHQNETYLKIMDYLTAHRPDIFSKDRETVLQYRAVLLSTLPADARTQVFEQLRQFGGSNATVWALGKIGYHWALVGHSDCSGHDIAKSDGANPDKQRCGPSNEGQVAVCWNGREFRNGSAAAWCTYKVATPQSCVGGGAIGEMHQCVFEIGPDGSSGQ